MAIFPFLVGFAPPDAEGTFISFAGGQGVYPSSSCGNHYRNEYSEIAAAADHRFKNNSRSSWVVPGYVTLGVFGERGERKKTLVWSEEDSSNVHENPVSSRLEAVGGHLALDWRYFGLDVGGLYLKMPGDDSGFVVPRASLRIGPSRLYVSASALEGRPLFSDGALVNMGMGTYFGPLQLWYGVGVGPFDLGGGVLRMRYAASPFAFNLTLQGDPISTDKYTPGLKNHYGMSAGLEFRLP